MTAHKLETKQNLVNWSEAQDAYAALRETADVVRVEFPFGGEGWMTTTYDMVREMYNDPNYSIEIQSSGREYPRMRYVETDNSRNPSFMQYDGAKHQAKRAVLTKYLTIKRVNALRESTQQIIEETLDELEALGSPVDFTVHFAKRVPLRVLCALLGMPTITDQAFIDACYKIVDSRVENPAELMAAYGIIVPFFNELYEEKSKHPGDDLMSAMIQDKNDGLWSEDELRNLGTTLLLAAHDATGVMLNGQLEWLSHEPELYARLRAEPESFPRAFEELLRLVSVGTSAPRGRVALEDAELGGVAIAAGEAIAGNLLAANTDPAVFPDPMVFDMDRPVTKPHVAFGSGPHACPGMHLARMEITLALQEILRRYETFENVEPHDDWRSRRLCKSAPEVVVAWKRA
ncbi:cytochrome P450 [Agromyces rhizosphaerae]|uniref:Cytochrome P450 n=1 Tax=Agromyces rhizosphaerae TaxID=88374 RepID=A0A9W6FSV8_9MICO|nr:cytochrome P450 [Agromyces rhizosphaerae]GLI28593.1 cytochrome P450 [Agromyces rhizosphaerae]